MIIDVLICTPDGGQTLTQRLVPDDYLDILAQPDETNAQEGE